MSPATFISERSAQRIALKLQSLSRRARVRPHFNRGCLEGYRVILKGRALTDAQVEALV